MEKESTSTLAASLLPGESKVIETAYGITTVACVPFTNSNDTLKIGRFTVHPQCIRQLLVGPDGVMPTCMPCVVSIIFSF